MHTLLSLLFMSGLLSFFLPESTELIQEEVSQWYEPVAAASALDQEITFWQNKLNAAPNQLTYNLQLAAAYEERFATYSRIEDLKTAESLLANGLERSSIQRVSFLRALARNYISQHRFQEALVLAEAAIAHSDSRLSSTYLLFDVYMEVGHYTEAAHLLTKMVQQGGFQYLLRKAKWEDHKGNLNFAIDLLEEAKATLDPQQDRQQAIWLYANLADFYGHAGRIEEAYELYKSTLELDPAHWYAYKGLAWIAYAHDKQAEKARTIVHEIMRYNDSPDLHLFLAELYKYAGNTACATAEEATFQITIQHTDYGHMYRIPQLELFLANGKTEHALALAELEVKERPTPEMYGFLSTALFAAGMQTQAEALARNEVWEKTVEPVALLQLKEVFPKDDRMQAFIADELDGAAFEIGPLTYAEIKK